MSEAFEYASESELLDELKSYMRDPKNVEIGADYLYKSLIDETILGIVFEIHHEHKTGIKAAVEGELEDQKYKLIDLPDVDVFGSANVKKAIDCTCPNCDRLVAASRFAPHLEKCMGMGRATRVASRRIASSREGNNFFGSSIAISDDEDDADWSSEKKKKRLPSKYERNGSKKNGKS